MPDRHAHTHRSIGRRLIVSSAAALAVLIWSPTMSALATTVEPDVVTTDATGSEPPTSDPGTTMPADTTPSDTTPTDTTPADTTPPATLVGVDPDLVGGDVALVAVVGLVVVLSLAAWWMVRRKDEGPVPDPPSSSGDLI